MKPLRLADVPASAVVRGDPLREITGVVIDSRDAGPGDLFVAIRGGVEHVDAAARAGAAVVVEEEAVERAANVPHLLQTFSSIRCLQCLGDVNAAATSALRVGITGSTGKTSTKDAVAHLVGAQRRVVAAASGHNNEIGYPLTLTRIDEDTEVAVCELAMRGLGQIAELCAIAQPDVGVITNVGVAHIELLGSRERIAEAKAEIIAGTKEGGQVVLPFAEPLLDPYVRDDVGLTTFGEEAGADVQLVDRRIASDGQDLTYLIDGDLLPVHTNLRGRHHAFNLAAALAVCRALGLDLGAAAASAADVPQQAWRGELEELPGGVRVINDAYNANPASMEAGLRLLAETPTDGRRIAVLGLMAELGDDGPAFHRDIGALAARIPVDMVVAVGEPARGYLEGAGAGVDGQAVADVDEAVERLAGLVQPGDLLLVKGSRAAGLEVVPGLLRERLERRG